MNVKSFAGLLLVAVFGVVIVILLVNKLYLSIRDGYIIDPSNRRRALSGWPFYATLLLYVAGIMASSTASIFIFRLIMNNPPSLQNAA
ncbi:MAG: hypothetical protein GF313_06435 [Caldithrix sp.]|nr:hypothetical protein [Caldithrix sp.]